MTCPPNAERRWKKRSQIGAQLLILRQVSNIRNLKLGNASARKIFLWRIQSCRGEASAPRTEPRGKARAIFAVTLPSPQPTSRMCSPPRKLSERMSSRAQICCTTEARGIIRRVPFRWFGTPSRSTGPNQSGSFRKTAEMFMLCTVRSARALTRLSSALITINRPVRESNRHAISMIFVPTTFFVSGRFFPSSKRMNGSVAVEFFSRSTRKFFRRAINFSRALPVQDTMSSKCHD